MTASRRPAARPFHGVPRMWSHAAPEAMLAPEPALPAQVLHLWHHTCAIAPERALALAVLAQAVTDVRRYQETGLTSHRALHDAARDWMLCDDGAWPFSFVNLCATFELATDAVRAELFAAGREPRRRAA